MPLFFREVRLRVASLQETAAFYSGKLDLCVRPPTQFQESAQVVSFESTETAVLSFLEGAVSSSKPADGQRCSFVWIGLAGFPDVRQTVESLKDRGVGIKLQGQFEDIAFVAHGVDNNGITFECLQTTMEHNFKPTAVPDNALRANAVLGQVKLNVFNPKASLEFYTDVLWMRLLSQQRCDKYKFTLYFLAFSHASDDVPNPDPNALENREWLWQKQFTQLELQHWDNTSAPMWLPAEGAVGLDSCVFEGSADEVDAVRERLVAAGKEIVTDTSGGFGVRDPDGQLLRFTCSS
jgi:catechol 2,3-dioxygenase-like lactoylglutathione lyase family enzyme